jgi:hypothetical protein
MMFAADSEALIALETGKSESGNHHSGFVGSAKYWDEPSTVGYFHKNARLHAVLQHVVASTFAKSGDERRNVCSEEYKKVSVTRSSGGIFGNEYTTLFGRKTHAVAKYELIATPLSTKNSEPDVESIEASITQCHWIGQNEVSPHFDNNIAPRPKPASTKSADEQKNACYTGHVQDEVVEEGDGIFQRLITKVKTLPKKVVEKSGGLIKLIVGSLPKLSKKLSNLWR